MATADLFSLFQRRGANGEPMFSAEEIRHFLPLVLLAFPEQDPNPAVSKFMGDFFLKIGVSRADEVSTRVEAYFKTHPPHPGLVLQFREWVRAQGTGSAAPDLSRFISSFE